MLSPSPAAWAAPGAKAFGERLFWARNIGGDAYVSRAGEAFRGDRCADAAVAGRCARIERVHRTQDPALHDSYRAGDQCFHVPLPEGAYDLVLYFTEPPGAPPRARVFDVSVEGRRRLTNFRVAEAAPGSPSSAMTRAFNNIAVDDGALDTCIESRVGEAVISGLVVRRAGFSTDGWNLVWEDDFSDPASFADNWSAEVWKPGRVNDEAQAYTDDPRNVRIENGRLVLEAHTTGQDYPAYTSGRVHSWGHRAFRYGRLDIRARVPEGRGVWPALWLLPDDPYRYATRCSSRKREWQGSEGCDAWPNSGEIDLMEHIGYEPGVVHGTVHTRDYYSGHGNQVGGAILLPDLGEAFHTYSLVWREGEMAMYVDGARYFAYFDDGDGHGQWPFDHAFHIVMNLAIGGAWGAAHGPIEDDALPRRLEVDYVRLYRREEAAPAP